MRGNATLPVLLSLALALTSCTAPVTLPSTDSETGEAETTQEVTADTDDTEVADEQRSEEEAPEISQKTTQALDVLAARLGESSAVMMQSGEDVADFYSELNWTSVADTFPEKFDLRNRDTVTSVKDQDPWSSCWSFATTSASETSILDELGLTNSDYHRRFGESLDLSERHLAWFTATALPGLDEYPKGSYPYDEGLAGEGLHFLEGEDTNPMNSGGNYLLSTSSLAAGVGAVKESFAPYENKAGNREPTGDWSLPEEDRFVYSFELTDANILPASATHDEDGSFRFRPEAIELVKHELMQGRAVGVSISADKVLPEPTASQVREEALKEAEQLDDLSEEGRQRYVDALCGTVDLKTLTDAELKGIIARRLRIFGRDEAMYEDEGLSREQLERVLLSPYFGNTYDYIVETEAKAQDAVMCFIEDGDDVIYAQYADEWRKPNHAVTVVGWDDTFPATSWPEDRRPPADGVWIVKNSWGEGWGNDGYFLLSYFDMTLCAFASFEFNVSEADKSMGSFEILEHDLMPAEIVSSTLFEEPVWATNVFTLESDSVLQYVMAMTGDLNTSVTASVFLLDDEADTPATGTLLETVTETFLFAGYHRMELPEGLLLPKGSRIAVTVLERVPTEGGTRYALTCNASFSKEGALAYNAAHPDGTNHVRRYAQANVNEGESLVSFEAGSWLDWRDAIDHITTVGNNRYMAYDNLPIKAYAYPAAEVTRVHDLSRHVLDAAGEAAVCPADGYTLLDVTGMGF